MRLWLSLAMLAVGGALLALAQLAGAAPEQKSGVLRVGTTGASVQVDPQLAYITTAWWLEYATAAKLYNYPDKRGPAGSLLQPEVASGFKVSNGGKRYTFFIRKGFRFSDGTPVTARNFAYAIDRVANHDLASPAAYWITDPNGTDIVGAKDVMDGHGTHVSGVRVRGNRLIINLTEPDGTFMSKITMPFFQATSTELPIDREVVEVDSVEDLPSAGPYTFTRNDVNRLTSIRRNPYWRRGPGRQRPRNLTGLDLQWNLNEQTAFNQVLASEIDETPWVPAAYGFVMGGRFGVNRTRFWSMPVNCTGYLAMNMSNHLFKGNVKLRQAINYAISRREYVDQAGPYAGRPWTHLFNPGVPGWRNVNPYPVDPDLHKARALSAGHFRDGKINFFYWSSGTVGPAQAQIVRQDLINLGFEPANITMTGYSGGIYYPPAERDNPFDLITAGWCSDYPDPFDWINVLFYGGFIKVDNNDNYSYMDVPRWNRKMEAAAKLVGPRRLKIYGQMDLDLMRDVAPIVVTRTYNNRYLFSDRVDPKHLVYQGIYSDWSIPALALK